MPATTADTHPPIQDVIGSAEELRALLGEPNYRSANKDIGRLDEHCRAFIGRSPFALVGSSNAAGRGDVSPKGDAPGFALVLDEHTLVIPERPGNKRADTFSNVISNPEVGLLFIVPGTEHTLRVNGRARLARDGWLLEQLKAQGKTPILALVVDVREAYFHCAKAFIRSKLWDPERHATPDELASFGCVLSEQLSLDQSGEELDRELAERNRTMLY